MTPTDTHPELPELFARAEELAPAERERFLAELAAREPALAREVAELLAAGERAAAWLNRPSWTPVSRPAALPLPTTLGPYRVLAELGQGGAGRVFLGEEHGQGFVRRVAVKVLAGTLPGSDAIERFRTEGRILAALEHPGIARLYDAGTTAEGSPFLAMEYIDGVDLVTFAHERRLGTRARVVLFLQVLEAVQFAHRHLIVHRDLKPANLLVNATGQVKLLDFGIAKLLAGEGGDETLTRTGQRWLTPAYAAPEQLRGERPTTAGDLYSLGIVLYELLAGRRPTGATGDPAPPSRVAGPFAEPGVLTPTRELEGDLDAIVLFALRQEPEARYGSAEAFAEDLRRHLEGFPVLARQGTRRYRWGKFVRRNRRSLIAAAAVFAALAGGLGAALWQARQAAEARAVAERRFTDLQGLASTMIFEVAAAIEPLDGAGPAMELTMDRGLEYLDRLEADGRDDLLEDLATGYERVGSIGATLPVFGRGTGRWEKGIAALDRALELRRRLAALPGAPPEARLKLSRALVVTCGALRAGRAAERVEAVCAEAVAILEALVAAAPDRPELRFELAAARTQKLFVEGTLGGAAAAARSAALDRTAALWLSIGADPPASIRWRHDFAWGLGATSYWLRLAGRPEEALTLARWAVAATEAPEPATKLDMGAIRPVDRAVAVEALANAHWDLDHPREALEGFEAAYSLSAAHRRQDRRQQDQIRLFNLVGPIARLCGEVGEVDRGERALLNGTRLLDEATGWKPDTVIWSRGLIERDRGHLYRAAGERPGLPAATRRAHTAQARRAYARAAEFFESLLAAGEDPFGAKDSAAECRRILGELAGAPLE